MHHDVPIRPTRSRARAVAVARREAEAQARARLWLTGGAVLLALTLLALVLFAPATARAQMFNAETFTLDNGLQVVVVPNHRVPVVTHMVWYKVGAADEPAGKSGIAHLLEHLMFKGTDKIEPGTFSKIVARNGGRDNAFTSSDFTGYYQNIARDRLETVMAMEADRMVNLRLTEDDFQTERAVVTEERLSRTENEPAALLGERMDQALWSVHPYKNPIIGWAHELAALTRADALAFYHRYYAPNNAVVVVAGDITADELRPMAERTYGQVPAAPDTPERHRVRDLPPPVDITMTMSNPRVAQASWWRHIIAPSANTEHAELYAPLQVLAELLGGGPVSRLYDRLVVEDGVAVSAGAGYSGRAVDYGTFSLYATPAAGRTPTEVGAAIDAEIARLLADGVTEAEVAGAKTRLKASVVYARDNPFGAARILGTALATGGTVDDVEHWPEAIAAVTPDDVMAAARAVFQGASAATAILQPDTTS
ncbi:insulinase family protein [Roseospira marina]|uniref:Insulinase family protein n=1 Tax=Roseospira marina TaxID=140057 RepID=A0A5M6ICL2_9PROT|nr:pitrilysin family protein [Roseospira marina]KAA5605509.1 insulinase family protein [Roseospira marina]MBB4314485.1 zinc protease [Roseospira marina]MBB5088687.1 zinc protease [Roseospira marina]